jgi:hypothetical protein
MEVLSDCGPMASWEVAEKVDRGSNFVRPYLYRLRKYGVTAKEEEMWFLTDFGDYLTDLLIGQETDRYRYRYKSNTRVTQEKHKSNTSQPKSLRQISLDAWSLNCDLGEAERGVVDMLVAHYNKTGSKFLLVKDHYALSNMLSINVDTVVDAVTKLRQDHLIYLISDRISGCFKLGLKSAFVETLERAKLK